MEITAHLRSNWAGRLLHIAGRGLLALLFIPAGVAKLGNATPFLAHMAAYHVPGFLLPFVAALEIGGGAAVILGLFLRPAALALGLFCVATASIFHSNLGDHVERTMFLKDLAIAGGLFVLASSQPTSRYLADAKLD